MPNSDSAAVAAILGLGTGLWLFYQGFKELKLKRTIKGLATSKVRSMAMGTVELFGQTAPTQPLPDPIFHLPCVYYKIEVKEKRGSGKNSRWVSIYNRNSSLVPFYLVDETGQIPILPAGAQLFFDKDIDMTTNFLTKIFSKTEGPMEQFLSSVAPYSATETLHLTAYIVRENEPIYVLGYATHPKPPLTFKERLRQSMIQLARRIKSDPEKMSALDVNKDGSVDVQEWEAGIQKLENDLESQVSCGEATSDPIAPPPPGCASSKALLAVQAGDGGVMISKSPEGLLVLADKPEKEFLQQLGFWSVAKIIGGPVLAIICAAYLVLKLR